jgi:hypothetical protein
MATACIDITGASNSLEQNFSRSRFGCIYPVREVSWGLLAFLEAIVILLGARTITSCSISHLFVGDASCLQKQEINRPIIDIISMKLQPRRVDPMLFHGILGQSKIFTVVLRMKSLSIRRRQEYVRHRRTAILHLKEAGMVGINYRIPKRLVGQSPA